MTPSGGTVSDIFIVATFETPIILAILWPDAI
jgi:hypothetical protein